MRMLDDSAVFVLVQCLKLEIANVWPKFHPLRC